VPGRSRTALLAAVAALASACSSSSANSKPDGKPVTVTAIFADAPSRVHATDVDLVAPNDATRTVGDVDHVTARSGGETAVRIVLDSDAQVSRSVRATLCSGRIILMGAGRPPYLVTGDVLPMAVTDVVAGPCHSG
jgi:hypothetical protein